MSHGSFIQQPSSGGGAPSEFMGDWDGGSAYAANQMVSHDGGIWRATEGSTGKEPGGVVFIPGAYMGVLFSGVFVHQHDRVGSTSYVTKHITAASDIDGGSDRPAEPIVVDKSASQTTVSGFAISTRHAA